MAAKASTTSRVCFVEGCERRADGGYGLCDAHYQRRKRGAPLDKPIQEKGAGLAWLRAHAGWAAEECLIYPFPRSSPGYGIVVHDGRKIGAHRLMCEWTHGPAPTPKHDARHLCGKGQQGCVNPRHLVWGTRKENVADTIVHGTVCRGEKRPNAILTEEQARAIFLDPRPQVVIARAYGVDRGLVKNIWQRTSWAWATADLIAPERPNANRRLSDEDVRAIRKDQRSGNEIAAVYGIKRKTVYAIRGGRRRRLVENDNNY